MLITPSPATPLNTKAEYAEAIAARDRAIRLRMQAALARAHSTEER
jgi:hypothetical protein